MQIGDKVGLLETGVEWQDTFAGTEVEIVGINDQSVLTVRTHNGHEFRVMPAEVVPGVPPKKMGRPKSNRPPSTRRPIKRLVTTEPVIRISASLRESDIAYLETFNPVNLSDAIRKLIEAHKERNSNV